METKEETLLLFDLLLKNDPKLNKKKFFFDIVEKLKSKHEKNEYFGCFVFRSFNFKKDMNFDCCEFQNIQTRIGELKFDKISIHFIPPEWFDCDIVSEKYDIKFIKKKQDIYSLANLYWFLKFGVQDKFEKMEMENLKIKIILSGSQLFKDKNEKLDEKLESFLKEMVEYDINKRPNIDQVLKNISLFDF